VYRNIHPKQSVLLDLCKFIKSRNLLKFELVAGEEVSDYCILDGNNKDVTLKIYQKSGETIPVGLNLEWRNGNEPLFTLVN